MLLPDLLAYWLTGELRTEITNASTTGLLDARRRSWSAEAFDALGIPADLLPPLIEPGETVGVISPRSPTAPVCPRRRRWSPSAPTTPPRRWSRVPAADRDIAYVSSGTWCLVGLELTSR